MPMLVVPAGAVPLGFPDFDPQLTGDGPIPILADYVDPLTGDVAHPLMSRTPVDGMIIETLRVERGSGEAVQSVGTRLREIRYVDDQIEVEARARVREGFEEMVRANLVEIQSLAVQLGPTTDSVILSSDIKDLTLPPSNQVQHYTVRRGL